MAIYRKINVTFWSDPFIESLTPEGRYFYLYLLTNTMTKQCGIYEITRQTMCKETGYNVETVSKLVAMLEKSGRIKYSRRTNEIALKNWPKYNSSDSPKIQACVDEELRHVKNKALIQYQYSIDASSQQKEEQEQEQKEEQEQLPHGEDFKKSWTDWKEYRRQARKKMTPATVKSQLSQLGKQPENIAIAMIEQSIGNGWTGLFGPKPNAKAPRQKAFNLKDELV